jgi:translation initiation factor IF-3
MPSADNQPKPPQRPFQGSPTPAGNQGNFQQKQSANQVFINEAIRSPKVRLISSTGEQLGIVSTRDALDQAKQEDLDLVVISMQNPPVAKIMDYGKYKFEKEKEEKEKKKKSKSQSVLKELKMSPRIDEHDLQVKERWICKWLEEGNKAKVVVQLKGRELQHPELARKLLSRILEVTAEFGKSENQPAIRQEGKTFNIQLSPLNPKKPL